MNTYESWVIALDSSYFLGCFCLKVKAAKMEMIHGSLANSKGSMISFSFHFKYLYGLHEFQPHGCFYKSSCFN